MLTKGKKGLEKMVLPKGVCDFLGHRVQRRKETRNCI